MIRPATAVVSILVLLACPLMCLGRAGGGDWSIPAAGCCPHCPASVPSDAHPSEGEEVPASPVPSCCLCKGAITDRAAVDWQPDDRTTPMTVEPWAAGTTVNGAAAEGPRLRESPAPHSGRMLRLEHCALTC